MADSYSEDELLALSGIQHFAFCERQWALIHIERQWEENVRTVEGKHIHERVDNGLITEKRGSILTTRAVPVASRNLGLYGITDAIEFSLVSVYGIVLKGRDGLWLPKPVEYKRGKPKTDIRDHVQLCAQAMCLEEMLGVSLEVGDLYYDQIKHREKVEFSDDLRCQVQSLARHMHQVFAEERTPRASLGKNCKLCSMIEVCMPKLTNKSMSVKNYMEKQLRYHLSEETYDSLEEKE